MNYKVLIAIRGTFIIGFIFTVAALYLYIGNLIAAAAAIGGLSVPVMRFVFPSAMEKAEPAIKRWFFAPITSTMAAVVIWLCFFGVLVGAGDLVLAPFVKTWALRDKPEVLTQNTIKQLVMNKGFFDSNLNPSGRGVTNLLSRRKIGKSTVVVDDATNLMWEYCSSDNFVEFGEAEKHIEELNIVKHAGFANWRIPTLEEAYSILEAKPRKIDRYTLHIEEELGEKCPFIWTSDREPDADREPWVVSYLTGDSIVSVTNNITREYTFSARAVRSILPAVKK